MVENIRPTQDFERGYGQLMGCLLPVLRVVSSAGTGGRKQTSLGCTLTSSRDVQRRGVQREDQAQTW